MSNPSPRYETGIEIPKRSLKSLRINTLDNGEWDLKCPSCSYGCDAVWPCRSLLVMSMG
jgi:hypothetical protein